MAVADVATGATDDLDFADPVVTFVAAHGKLLVVTTTQWKVRPLLPCAPLRRTLAWELLHASCFVHVIASTTTRSSILRPSVRCTYSILL